MVLMTGCAGGRNKKTATASTDAPPPRVILDAGYQALESQQYNEAIAKADEFLAGTPAGPGSAEALYLKGRGFEGKNAAGVTPEEAKQNLQSARVAYIQALEQNPKDPLAAYIHASLGNVAYFQDYYQSAMGQLNAAYDKLDNNEVKAWTLYRVGLCQQRLGQFKQADATFASVEQFHPGTVPAERAKEHRGARAFWVQLATFASPANADKAVMELKHEGINASRAADAQGRALLRVGPLASYSQALFIKQRFAEKYPDAIILP
jgi:tetratricopeptide (TPR) repeat protein